MSNETSTSASTFRPSSYSGGTFHHYLPALTAYEHSPPAQHGAITTSTKSVSTLIFINGMYGTPLSTAYTITLHAHLPAHWRLVEPLLSSAGTGFGTASLTKDVYEVSSLVRYIRQIRPNGRIVLLGHSTGCQDAIHYVCSPGREERRKSAPVDGVILQAPVSDREATAQRSSSEVLKPSVDMAQKYMQEGRADDVLPSALTKDVYADVPMTARRWLSLISPGPLHDGEDDYFSSDLDDARFKESFGKGGKGLKWLVLHGEVDEGVPESVDKEGLLKRWKDATEEGGGIWAEGSGVLPGADHPLEMCGDEVREEFSNRVVTFLKLVEK